ncbi:MAG: late competence development ComFB family protein [Defluviitaleaceae bacterium]|nr:late competence development ComFB family protein [Defluviitaleaceae bacterium]
MIAIKNYMSDLVENSLDTIAQNINCCLCDRCRMDIMALALNNLPSKYIVTDEGGVYAKTSLLAQQFEVDVLAATMNAVMLVSKNPRH